MYLSGDEERILKGAEGEGKARAMEILVALGKIYGADRLIPVSSVQVSGVSYKTIGDAGLDFLETIAGEDVKASVPSFLNPAGMDIKDWERMGIPEDFAQKQMRIHRAFMKIGIKPTYTCAPYQIGIRPALGEHIAWAESNAVVFANSVLGARTNRESSISALASAIIGKTPNFGLHLDENRIADLIIEVNASMKHFTDFGALGVWAGRIARNRILAFTGLRRASEDELKSLGAAMAASGGTALFYSEGNTPEWKVGEDAEKVSVEEKEIKEVKMSLTSSQNAEIVTIGCPHASLDEIREIAELIRDRKLKRKLWVCTSRETRKKAEELGYVKLIEMAGGLVVADTCMVVCPLERMGFHSAGVNSGKAAIYLPTLCHQKVKFSDIRELLE